MTDLERYVLEEHVEDWNDGLIDRRELLRRVTLITGSLALTAAVLETMGCGGPPSGARPAAATPGQALPQAYATPPATGSNNPITVALDDPRIKIETVSARGRDGAQLLTYCARPAAATASSRRPGVLVIHENRGLVDHIRDVVRRVATAGFAGVAVDLLSRDGGADKLTDPAAYAASLAKRVPLDMVSDLAATLDAMRGAAFVQPDRLGVTGFCFGGGMVWNLLAAGSTLRAAVPFYGPPPANLDGLASTPAAVLAVYAEQDTRITASSADVEARLKLTGHPYQIRVFAGANHAFHNDTGARYVPGPAQAAWVATVEWFRKYLT